MTEQLKPCRACGEPCRIEVIGANEILCKAASLWVCSNHSYFKGDCRSTVAYLTEEAWNNRPSADVVEALLRAKEALAMISSPIARRTALGPINAALAALEESRS